MESNVVRKMMRNRVGLGGMSRDYVKSVDIFNTEKSPDAPSLPPSIAVRFAPHDSGWAGSTNIRGEQVLPENLHDLRLVIGADPEPRPSGVIEDAA